MRMRILGLRLFGLGLAGLILSMGSLQAEDSTESTLPPLPHRYERPRASNCYSMERAQYRAQQRMLRMEARAWRGTSTLRPYVGLNSPSPTVNPQMYYGYSAAFSSGR